MINFSCLFSFAFYAVILPTSASFKVEGDPADYRESGYAHIQVRDDGRYLSRNGDEFKKIADFQVYTQELAAKLEKDGWQMVRPDYSNGIVTVYFGTNTSFSDILKLSTAHWAVARIYTDKED